MEKINIAELLKDCPSGMELDCVSYDNVSFDKISDDKKAIYPIFCYITDKEGNRSSISFTENGCESKRYGAKCVIYPKGKTTWEGFVPPYQFKDGDIIFKKNFVTIVSYIEPSGRIWYHCWYNAKYKECKVSLTILGVIIYSYIQTKRKGENTFGEFTLPWFFIPLLLVVNSLLFSAEHHKVIYNYEWRYTCKIYYYDGGSEVRCFNCGGSQYPRIMNSRGGFVFVCGDNIVNAVTRFEVIKKEKINYESD